MLVRNVGGSRSGRIKVCASIRGRGLRISGKGRCRSLGRLAAKRRASLRFRVKAKRRTGRRGSAKVKFKVTENGRRVAGANARVRIS